MLTKLDPVLALVFLALRVVSFAHRLVSAMSVPPLRHARRNGHGQASEPAGVPAGRPAGRQDGAGRSEEQQRQHRVATAAQRRAEEGAGGRAHQRAHLARCRAAAVRSRVSAAQPLARRQSCGHEARALTVRVRCAHVHEHARRARRGGPGGVWLSPPSASRERRTPSGPGCRRPRAIGPVRSPPAAPHGARRALWFAVAGVRAAQGRGPGLPQVFGARVVWVAGAGVRDPV